MGLQNSGAISLDDLHVEVGGTSGTTCSLNDADIRALIDVGSGAGQSIQQYYGQSSETSLPTGGSQINGQVQLKQITASSYISSGGTLRVPSNMWVWSDSRTVAALIIDISCTVINDGKIIGKGGKGRWYQGGGGGTQDGHPGGPAISVTASGVTITNSSGAYIAGGGGGGSNGQDGGDPQDQSGGGGGGAGGGEGGNGHYNRESAGGTLNAIGEHAKNPYTGAVALSNGGGAGGGGGGAYAYPGGGGGRILPGSGGVFSSSYNWGSGGSAGNVGYGPGPAGQPGSHVSGGGGGWGAAGGNGSGPSYPYNIGGAGGAAITGVSRTLSNSGTIYGST